MARQDRPQVQAEQPAPKVRAVVVNGYTLPVPEDAEPGTEGEYIEKGTKLELDQAQFDELHASGAVLDEDEYEKIMTQIMVDEFQATETVPNPQEEAQREALNGELASERPEGEPALGILPDNQVLALQENIDPANSHDGEVIHGTPEEVVEVLSQPSTPEPALYSDEWMVEQAKLAEEPALADDQYEPIDPEGDELDDISKDGE